MDGHEGLWIYSRRFSASSTWMFPFTYSVALTKNFDALTRNST
jgi:hypothetical protein